MSTNICTNRAHTKFARFVQISVPGCLVRYVGIYSTIHINVQTQNAHIKRIRYSDFRPVFKNKDPAQTKAFAFATF